MENKWLEYPTDVIDVKITAFLHDLSDADFSYEREEMGTALYYTLFWKDSRIGQLRLFPSVVRRGSELQKIETRDDSHTDVFQRLLNRLIDHLDTQLVLVPQWFEELRASRQSANDGQAEPQADSDAVVEQLTPAEEESGEKPGPIHTKLDVLLAGQTAIRRDLSGLRQAVLARFDTSEQTIIAAVIERLDQDQLATVQAVLDTIEAGVVPIGELEETLVAVQHLLSEIQQQGVALPDSTLTSEEFERLSEVVDAPKLDAKHKLKVTVPIIPYFLSYEGEVELKSGLNLEAAWKRLVAKVRGT